MRRSDPACKHISRSTPLSNTNTLKYSPTHEQGQWLAISLPSLKKGDPHARAPAARQQRNKKVWLFEGGGVGCVDVLPFGEVLFKPERLGTGFSL